jgi:hypothetical protein
MALSKRIRLLGESIKSPSQLFYAPSCFGAPSTLSVSIAESLSDLERPYAL